MIIKAKPLNAYFFSLVSLIIRLVIRRKFNKVFLSQIDLKAAHSYLVMSNHFSFWDGILAFYLSNEVFRKKGISGHLYIMVLEKQMHKNWWLKYAGAFSIAPGKTSVSESLDFAKDVLRTPGNILLMYPQGRLESMHVRDIEIREGVGEIYADIEGNCQLIWCSTVIDYFESLKPSLYFNLLDLGTNKDTVPVSLQGAINIFHKQSIKSQFRYTREH